MITVQIFNQAKNLSPKTFSAQLQNTIRSQCEKYKGTPPEEGIINGKLVSMFIGECDNPSKDALSPQVALKKRELVVVKITQGKEALYVAQRAWHSDSADAVNPMTTEKGQKEWLSFFRSAEVCDLYDRTTPCNKIGLLSHETTEAWAKQKLKNRSNKFCEYQKSITILPQTDKPIRPPFIVPIHLGLEPISDKKGREFLSKIIEKALASNSPLATILAVSKEASTTKKEDLIKATEAVEVIRDVALSMGANEASIVTKSNPSCL